MLRSTLSVLAIIIIATFAGCGGGGGGSSRAGSAAPVVSSAAPDPGGSVGPLSSATTPVAAQTTLGAFGAFRENVSLADLAIPDAIGLRDRAFAVEDGGTVRIIDLSGPTPTLERALPLVAAPLAPGIACGALSIMDERTALVTASGAGGEAVYLFDPSIARVASDVKAYDLDQLTITWPAGTLNSKGVDVGGRALPLTYTAGALLTSGKLLFCSSNLDASFDNNPGTVLAFSFDPATRDISNPVAFQTTDFNPTGLTRVRTAGGDVVLVTNTGLYGAGPSSIDIIDPATLNFVGTIPLGARNAGGPVVVSPDGRRGYVASSGAAEVYVLDLERLEDERSNTSKASRPARFLGGWTLPATSAMGYVSGLALSHTGNFLYAVNFNGSELFVLDLASPGVATRVSGFARSGNPTNYESLASKVAVRPGVPGTDFTGPSILVGTINLAVADRTLTNVKVVLDAVSVDRH